MDEKEYIDREVLLEFLQTTYNIPLDQWMARNYWSKVVEIKQKFISCIEKIPAADVAPVVHARWITEDNTEGYRGDPHCTACKYILLDEAVYGCTPGVDDYFYCPNCGAKMDGGKHG